MIRFNFESGYIKNYELVPEGTGGSFSRPVCRVCGKPMVVDKLKSDLCQMVCEDGCFDEAFMLYLNGAIKYYFELESVKKWEDERWEAYCG